MKNKKTKSSYGMKILKLLLVIMISVVSLLFVTPYLFKDQIDQGIKEIAKNYIKTEVRFKELNVSFFTHFPKLTVTLTESSIQGASPFENASVVRAKQIALGVDLPSLLGDKIIFNELFIDEASIELQIDSLGRNNYDVMVPTDELNEQESSPVGLILNDIRITNSNVVYKDQATKVELDLKGLDYNGLLDFRNNQLTLNADLAIKQSLFTFDQEKYIKNLPLAGHVHTVIDMERLFFDFKDNQLKLAEFPFELKGTFQLLEEQSNYDLKITSNKNQLSSIPPIVPEAYQEYFKALQLGGTSDIVFTMKGTMDEKNNQNPDIRIETVIKDGQVNYNHSKTPLQKLNVKALVDLPSLNPDQLNLKVDQLDFKLLDGNTNATFDFKAGQNWFTQGKINSSLDLEALKNATGFKTLATKGALNLEGEWKGNLILSKLNHIVNVPTFQMKVNLDQGYLKLDEMPAALEQISFDLEAHNTDGRIHHTAINIHHINAKALNNYIVGNFNIQNLKQFPIQAALEAKIRLEDIYKIYPLEGIDLKGDLLASMKANGIYDPQRKRVPVTQTKLVVKNGYLRMHDLPSLPMENISIETHIKSGRGSFQDLNIKVLPISFTLAGKPFMINADLKDFNHLNYRIHSKGQLKLGDFYQLFPIEGLDVDGLITANLGLQGKNGAALENIQNRGFVKLENITINTKFFPSKFKVKEGLFKFNGKDLMFQNVKARYRRNQFVFEGKVSNYINYALKENENLLGEIKFNTKSVNLNDFMAFNSGTNSNATSDEGVILLPKNVALKIEGSADQVKFNDLKLNHFKGDLQLNKGTLVLNDTQFGLIGSSFLFNGSYRPLNGRHARFSFDVKGSNFDIQRAYKEISLFREMVSAAEKAHGKASLDYHLEGDLGVDMFPRLKTVKGKGELIIEDVQFMGFKVFNSVAERTSTNALHDAKLKQVKVKTSIENNVMTIERTKFKVAGFRPRIEGQVTLDGYMNIGMRLGLPPFGIIGIPIKITGPADQFDVEVGRYEKEQLNETDEEYAEYQKLLEEEKTKVTQP